MLNKIRTISGKSRLQHYLEYLRNKDHYSPEDQASLEEMFEYQEE